MPIFVAFWLAFCIAGDPESESVQFLTGGLTELIGHPISTSGLIVLIFIIAIVWQMLLIRRK